MANGYALALRQQKLNDITAAIGNAGILTMYDGTQPTTGGAVTTQTTLAVFTLGSPFAPAATGILGGTVSISPNLPSPALVPSFTGTKNATWYRITTSGGTFVADGTISVTGGGGDIQLVTISLVSGMYVSIPVWVISGGNP